MIRKAITYLLPRAGRLTASQLAMFGQRLAPCAHITFGPFLVFIDLPTQLQKTDPPPKVRLPTLDELNSQLRELSAQGFSADC